MKNKRLEIVIAGWLGGGARARVPPPQIRACKTNHHLSTETQQSDGFDCYERIYVWTFYKANTNT